MMVKVYSTPTCPYCVALKNFLQENKIEFQYIDVSQNDAEREKMIEKTGQMGVPVIEIDNEVIVGFDRERISQLLNIKH
ncbi:MAG: glutaredoxin domain-containing protein [Patescibacteria group bacterium]